MGIIPYKGFTICPYMVFNGTIAGAFVSITANRTRPRRRLPERSDLKVPALLGKELELILNSAQTTGPRFTHIPASESCSYRFTAMACSSKCPPTSSEPAPMNSRAG
jgi:hypothetical protein